MMEAVAFGFNMDLMWVSLGSLIMLEFVDYIDRKFKFYETQPSKEKPLPMNDPYEPDLFV